MSSTKKFNFLKESRGISSAIGSVKQALSYIGNAAKLPTYLNVEQIDKIGDLSKSLGANAKVFERPLILALKVLNLPKAVVFETMESTIAIEVAKHSNALPASQKSLIDQVKEAYDGQHQKICRLQPPLKKRNEQRSDDEYRCWRNSINHHFCSCS